METEIRIYFESLEQSAHFIYPIVKKSLKKIGNTNVRMVKMGGGYENYGRKLASILFWKDPDILITMVKNGEEYPLLMLEFSNAVFTEDHELQRFDGQIAAAENNCTYVKISPLSKTSPSEHGGNIDFDYMKQYALIFQKFGRLFFHFDWKVDKNGLVIVDENFLSCPRRIRDFENLVSTIVTEAARSGTNDISANESKLLEYRPFVIWKDKLSEYNIGDATQLNTSRTRWNATKNILELKLNRFGHAMDPERGMLAFYGTMAKVISTMCFDEGNDAWYIDTPNESKIREWISDHGLDNGYDFLHCFSLGSGLCNNNKFSEIVKKYEHNTSPTLEIDITDFVKTDFSKTNKAIRTILKYSTSFVITDKNNCSHVTLKWNCRCDDKHFESNPHVTGIDAISSFSEDVVTYVTIQNVLKSNGYKILAASYPGAQADRAILIQPGTGRRQERKYIDVVAFSSRKKITSLQENKGAFSAASIQKDIDELRKYKTDIQYKNALKEFQKKFGSKSIRSIIKIGVGFWSNSSFTINKIKDMNIDDLDYFIFITSDMKKWKIWKTGKTNIFSKMDGDVRIPEFYEVVNKNL